MTTYYISPSGNNSNNGLGPDASAATNKPWLTLGKAMNTGSPLSPGDTVYIAPGYYFSSACTPIAGIASSGSPTQFIGDPTNAQGFKDGSGVLLAPGLPWVTQRSSGDTIDGPISSATSLFSASTNDPAGVQFKFLVLEASHTAGSIWACDLNAGHDNLWEDCQLIAQNILNFTNGTAGTAGRNLILRRCEIFALNILNASSTTAAATADADLGILVEECWGIAKFYSGAFALSASGGNLAGGVTFRDSTLVFPAGPATAAGKISTVAPIHVGGCLLIGGFAMLSAGTNGQIIDDGYNRIINLSGNASYVNVTQAGTSIIGLAPNLVLPSIVKFGLEMPRADFLGWTDAAHTNQKFSASGSTSSDFRGRTARPWGAGSSIGCFQARDLVEDTSSAISTGGANSAKLTGAGEFSLFVPVDAMGATISVVTKSTSYGGSNWPQMVVVANPSIGVMSDVTVTATSASEQTITTATITPTAKGVLEVRLISRSSSTTSATYFDVLTSP